MYKAELLELLSDYLPSDGTWDSPDITSDEASVSLGDCLELLERLRVPEDSPVWRAAWYGADVMLRNAARRVARCPEAIADEWNPYRLWKALATLPDRARQRLDEALIDEACADSDLWYSVWAVFHVDMSEGDFIITPMLDFGHSAAPLCLGQARLPMTAQPHDVRRAVALARGGVYDHK